MGLAPALRRRIVAVGLLAASAILTCSAVARAQGGSAVTLVWNAPEGCVDANYVQREIARLLGSSSPSTTDRRVTATVNVQRVGAVWHLELRTRTEDTEGVRTFHGESCRPLARAAAIVIALLVNADRVAAAEESEASVTPPAAPSPPRAPAVHLEAPPAEVPAKSPALRAQLAAGGLADVGTLPRVGAGVWLAGGATLGRLRLEAFGAWEPDHDVPLPPSQGGARFRKLAGGVRGCFAVLPGDVELGACLGGEAITMHAAGYGVRTPEEGSTAWLEVLLSAALRIALHEPFGLRVEAGAGFPLQRPSFVITPNDGTHTIAAVTGRAGLGLDVRF